MRKFMFLLHFSNVYYNLNVCTGHGIGIKDDDNDEEDGMDETLVPSDFNKSGLIRDGRCMIFILFLRSLQSLTT